MSSAAVEHPQRCGVKVSSQRNVEKPMIIALLASAPFIFTFTTTQRSALIVSRPCRVEGGRSKEQFAPEEANPGTAHLDHQRCLQSNHPIYAYPESEAMIQLHRKACLPCFPSISIDFHQFQGWRRCYCVIIG